MSIKIVVLIKQVPDTRNVGKNVMKSDGTVNRAALEAIFNPEDMNALEMALSAKDLLPNSELIAITMGPNRASDILRDALYRGADRGVLISDKAFAGSDTLATSYALSLAIKKLGSVNVVFAGRQAIDGDTAQVGPQIAEKLNIPQITYAEHLMKIENDNIVIKRRLDFGNEIVKSTMPCLITVNESAPACRFRNAKRVLKYKKINVIQNNAADLNTDTFYPLEEWNADFINPNFKRLGLSGSPTKVQKIENVAITPKQIKKIAPNAAEINEVFEELINSHLL